ncbi:MAG: heme-binding domain-containing protein [Acidobacteriota bacterium]
MRKLIIALALLTALQLVPAEMRTNPRSDPARSMEARLDVPSQIKSLLKNSCANCHSNETEWPWYSSLAPVSWVVAHDVNRARAAMNFSDWSDRPSAERGFLAAACAGVKSGRMPPSQYRILHPDAVFSPEETTRFCAWTLLEASALRRTAATAQ